MSETIYYMRIGDLCKRSGVTRYSIHHYLRLGLLPEPHRKNKTMAYYGDEHLERLNRIKHLRNQGFSLYVIQQMLSQKTGEISLDTPPQRKPIFRQSPKNKETKREEIIKAGGKIFSKKGYYHTGIKDITDALGIGKSTFYLYFRNKKELFFSCIDDIFDNLWKEDFARIIKETDIGHKLALRGAAFMRVYPRISDILAMMRGASVGQEEGIGKKYNEIYSRLVHPVIRDLEKAKERGEIKYENTELLAYILVGMTEAIAYRIHLDDKYTLEDGLAMMGRFNLLRLSEDGLD